MRPISNTFIGHFIAHYAQFEKSQTIYLTLLIDLVSTALKSVIQR